MALSHVRSIQALEVSDIIDTGCNPFRLWGNDYQRYICKHNIYGGPAWRMGREFIGTSFAQLWEIPTAKMAFVEILQQHSTITINGRRIDSGVPCLGSEIIPDVRDLNAFDEGISQYDVAKFIERPKLLEIALFDLWIGNDDRHQQNYNLLIAGDEKLNKFVAIDHEQCFNTTNFDYEIFAPDYEVCLLRSPLMTRFYTIDNLTNPENLRNIKKYFDLCVERCKNSLPALIREIPDQWLIPKGRIHGLLTLFDEVHKKRTMQTFLEYVQRSVNARR